MMLDGWNIISYENVGPDCQTDSKSNKKNIIPAPRPPSVTPLSSIKFSTIKEA